MKTTQTEWGHSRWASLERCPREHHLNYNLGIRSLESRTAASVGIALHRGLAARYDAIKLGVKIDPIRAITVGNEPTHVAAEARRLYDAYNRYWGDRGDFEKVIAVERHVRAKNVPFTTRLDLVVEMGKGEKVLVDHKSASASRGDFLAEHQASSQFVGSVLAWPWKRKGELRVVLNRIIKTNVPSFDRPEFVVSEVQVERFERDITLLEHDLNRYAVNGYWPRHRSSCQTRYGLCQFFALCHQGGVNQAANYKIPVGVDLESELR